MANWLTRKRSPSQPVSGANVRIVAGAFGTGSPNYALLQVNPTASAGIYNYHEGDLFAPGSGNFVFEPVFELPLQTIWGFGFIRNPNTFNPFQTPQVYAYPNVQTNGIGGLQAGEVQLQGLINPEGESAPFVGDFVSA